MAAWGVAQALLLVSNVWSASALGTGKGRVTGTTVPNVPHVTSMKSLLPHVTCMPFFYLDAAFDPSHLTMG